MKLSQPTELKSATELRSGNARWLIPLSTCVLVIAPVFTNSVMGQYNDFNGSFTDIRRVAGFNSSNFLNYPTQISDDGLTMLLTAQNREGSSGNQLRMYTASRDSLSDSFDEPALVDGLHRPGSAETTQVLSSDGLATYFCTDWSTAGNPSGNVWTATREAIEDDWETPTPLTLNEDADFNCHPSLSGDELSLYYMSISNGAQDIFKVERSSHDEAWSDPQSVAEVNTRSRNERGPELSRDDLAIIYTSSSSSASHFKIATRTSKDDPFGEPVALDDFGLGSELNSEFQWNQSVVISPDWPADGAKIYFSATNTPKGNHGVYEATWNVYADGDANLDDEVNFADFLILSENFGQDGAWREGDFDGDGMVGFPDFLALSENFGNTANTKAAAVPEPNAASLALFGLLGLIGIRKRR